MFAYKNKKRHKKIKQHFNNSTKATHNAKGADDIQTERKQHKGIHIHLHTHTPIHSYMCVHKASENVSVSLCLFLSVSG